MKVHIIMGSKSDMNVADKACKIFNEFGVKFETTVASAHRTPDLLKKVVIESDADVFIGIAGLSAALPGSIATLTTKPVIGVPVSGKVNLDAILSIVQMPPGIPVGAVGLDRGDNAALFAIEMLSLVDKNLRKSLKKYREKIQEKAISK
ncbi:MAG: 5-(carboxyamino)imidazole ribonucleotide mutase [Candidatus Thermoplasmatota archaeon]|nr:5-(carboxyamino)imidazole ribonucleotide mutase [Candidatus Thermoplasmatota archaeon]